MRKIKKNNTIKTIMYKLIRLLSIIIIILNFINSVYADDSDESEIENDNIANEVKIEQEKSMLSTSNQESQKPILNSKNYVILDRKSGNSIYGKDEKKQTAMASTTKIMTRNHCS